MSFIIESTYADGTTERNAIPSTTEAWRLYFANTTYPVNAATSLYLDEVKVADWARGESDDLVYGYRGDRAALLTEAGHALPANLKPAL